MPWLYISLQSFMLLILILYVVVMFYAIFLGVPPIPTPRRVRRQVAEVIESARKGTDSFNVADLGAGYGDVAFFLARNFPHASIQAYEYSPIIWALLWIRARFGKPRNLALYNADFLNQPLGECDVIFCFLGDKLMQQVQKKLQKDWEDMKNPPKEVLLISYTVPLTDWPLFKHYNLRKRLFPADLYVYKIQPKAFI